MLQIARLLLLRYDSECSTPKIISVRLKTTSKSITERTESKRADSRDGTRECREDCATPCWNVEDAKYQVARCSFSFCSLIFTRFQLRVERREVGRERIFRARCSSNTLWLFKLSFVIRLNLTAWWRDWNFHHFFKSN